VFAQTLGNHKISQEDFMNKRAHTPWLIALALLLGIGLSGIQVHAQQPAPNQSGQQAPDSQAQAPQQAPQQSQGQVFAGTIVKSGDKYVLQDASGTSYDIDRQDLAKKYEGQKVRINGTLDPDGKTIHVK
jgi:uncharacterized protein YdeI (BOF family)